MEVNKNKRTWKKILLISFLFLLILPIVNARTYEQPTNITGFQELWQWNNRVIDSNFGIGIILITFFTSFILLKGFQSSQALTGSLFFTMVTAIGCWSIGILNTSWVIGSVLLTALTAILILWSGN